MTSLAVCVGINEFDNLPTHSWLNGCVNDADDLVSLLTRRYGFADRDVTQLTNSAATKSAVMGALTEAMGRVRTGEATQLVFSFSSHGTQVPDSNADESDSVDEAFVTFDMRQSGDNWDPTTLIVDDELHNLFALLPEKALLDVILDTCHSGTGLRAIDLLPSRRPRFVPPPTPIAVERAEAANSRSFRDLVRAATDTGDTVEQGAGHPALFAACRSNQTAADANFGGRYSGAFTHFLIQALIANPYSTRADILVQVNADLRAEKFTQRAQLEAPAAGKRMPWGTPFARAGSPAPVRAERQARTRGPVDTDTPGRDDRN